MPFVNQSNDNSLTYLVDSIGETLSFGFSDFSDIEAISYISSPCIADENLGFNELKKKYNIDFVVSGKVNVSKEGIIVKTTLTDCSSQKLIWHKSYSSPLKEKNISEFLDLMISEILMEIGGGYGVIFRHLLQTVYNDNKSIQTSRSIIYDYKQNLLSHDPKSIDGFISSLEENLKNEPNYAEGWAWLCNMYCDYAQINIHKKEKLVTRANKFANQAEILNPKSAFVHTTKAYVSFFNKNLEEVIESSRKAININPNDAYLVGFSGFWLGLCGLFEEGIKLIEKTSQLNPYYPKYYHHIHMLRDLKNNEYESALNHARLFVAPDFYWSFIDQTAVLGLVGKIEEAEKSYKQLLELQPDFKDFPKAYLDLFVVDKKSKKKCWKYFI